MNRYALCVVVLLVVSVAGAAPVEVASKIESVIVYRGQALVTRTVELPPRAGELAVVVKGLPAQVIPTSLHVSAVDGVTIRSVRFHSQAATEVARKEVADLDAQIKQVYAEIHANAEMGKLLVAKSKHVDKLEGFTAATSHTEMSKGVLNLETLSKVSAFLLAQREALTKERIALYQQALELKEKLDLLKRRRAELTRGSQRTTREARVFLAKAAAKARTVQLRYLVNSANWSPSYNVRLGKDGRTVNMEYLAHVSQMSGEDWSEAKVTLSTATPTMNAQGPVLVAWWIGLQGAAQGDKALARKSFGQYAARQTLLAGGQYANTLAWNRRPGDLAGANFSLNSNAAQVQELELNTDQAVVAAGRAAVRSLNEGLAVSYELPGTMSLPSRSDQQLVQISAQKFPIDVHHAAIPLLGSYVYRMGRVTNASKVPLLAGPYSAYIDGEFVGQGRMPLVARGQSVTVGFGVDTQLRCSRELVSKSDKVAWGSRTQTFKYRIRVENYKATPVSVRLLDRIPATKSEDIQIKLGRLSDELSTDAVYLRDRRTAGVLRWDLRVDSGSAGAAARDVEYTFELKYAKDKHVGREAGVLLKDMERDNLKMMRLMM